MSLEKTFHLISKLSLQKYANHVARTYYTYSREPTMYLKKKTCWTSAEEALEATVKSGDQIVLHGAAASPIDLIVAMAKVAKRKGLKKIKTYSMHTEGAAPYAEEKYKDIFRHTAFFMGGNVRKAVAEGRADCMPIFLSEIPKLFYRRIIKPKICLIHVSPPDDHGYCS